MLCWGAPAGVEPEAGDTLLMITLKLGMEVTTCCCLHDRGQNKNDVGGAGDTPARNIQVKMRSTIT